MISILTDMAAVVVPTGAVMVAAAAAFAAAARRHVPATSAVVVRPRTADLGAFWAAKAIDGTTGVTTQRTGTSYDPPSRGSTG